MAIVSSVVGGPNVRAGSPAGFGDRRSVRAGQSGVIGREAELAGTIR
jgi:hypothetical protein